MAKRTPGRIDVELDLLNTTDGERRLLLHMLRVVRTAIRTQEQVQLVIDPHLPKGLIADLEVPRG